MLGTKDMNFEKKEWTDWILEKLEKEKNMNCRNTEETNLLSKMDELG